jgi:type IV fimbrial biogenesis protein FimT
MLSVISIAAIMTVLGVPSFRYVTNSNRVTAEVNQLYWDMEFGRSAAIRTGLPVTLCPSTDGLNCAAQSQSWQTGWIVFSDVNGNGTVDAGDSILRVQTAFPTTDTFVADQNIFAVTFNREGFALNLPGTPPGYITIALHTNPTNSDWTRCIQVTMVGMLTTEHTLQGACT